MSKMSLTEATMMALQGKLEESKPARRRTRKQENIDINVDEKTSVSVMDNETIVDTEDATIIVDKKEDEFVPETSDGVIDGGLPVEAPTDDVVEVPVEGDETIIPEDEVPVEQTDEDSAVLDADADVDLPLDATETEEDEDEGDEDKEESKKVESVEIEVSDDGKEVEVTTDNGEEVEVKDETPEENEEVSTEEVVDEPTEELEESKKEEAVVDENAYKSTNLFKALCDEVSDIVVEDDEQPTQEQIEQAVDVVINGYDYIWEDLHIALRTEIDKITGKGDGDEYRPRYESKSIRKSLGKFTENKVVKYSSKSFKEALDKFYKSTSKTIESVELTKFDMTKNTIILEAKLTNRDGMTTNKKLELKQIAVNKNFTKYSMTENSKLKTENKSAITMLVSTNKDNILECKYINKK